MKDFGSKSGRFLFFSEDDPVRSFNEAYYYDFWDLTAEASWPAGDKLSVPVEQEFFLYTVNNPRQEIQVTFQLNCEMEAAELFRAMVADEKETAIPFVFIGDLRDSVVGLDFTFQLSSNGQPLVHTAADVARLSLGEIVTYGDEEKKDGEDLKDTRPKWGSRAFEAHSDRLVGAGPHTSLGPTAFAVRTTEQKWDRIVFTIRKSDGGPVPAGCQFVLGFGGGVGGKLAKAPPSPLARIPHFVIPGALVSAHAAAGRRIRVPLQNLSGGFFRNSYVYADDQGDNFRFTSDPEITRHDKRKDRAWVELEIASNSFGSRSVMVETKTQNANTKPSTRTESTWELVVHVVDSLKPYSMTRMAKGAWMRDCRYYFHPMWEGPLQVSGFSYPSAVGAVEGAIFEPSHIVGPRVLFGLVGPPDGQRRLAVWHQRTSRPVILSNSGWIHDVSPALDAVGAAVVGRRTLPVFWSGAKIPAETVVLKPPAFTIRGRATGIAKFGDVVGSCTIHVTEKPTDKACLWRFDAKTATYSAAEILPTPPEVVSSSAEDINRHGAIVGSYQLNGKSQACVWQRSADGTYDLATELAEFPGTATSINSYGQIVGHAPDGSGRYHYDGITVKLSDCVADSTIDTSHPVGINDLGEVSVAGVILGWEREVRDDSQMKKEDRVGQR